jgi:hypothetical protein
MADLVFMKMMNEEDIVSTVLDENEDCYFITLPLKFIYNKSNRNNSISVAIIPWVPIQEIMNSIFQIYKNNIVTIVPTSEKLKSIYQSKIEESEESAVTKIQEFYDKLNSDPKLKELFMANTSSWIH